jgi:hypothetical protein
MSSRVLDFADGFETETPPEDISIPASEIEVTPAGDLTSENVQDALEELSEEIAAIPDPVTYKGTWNATTNTPTLANSDLNKVGFLYHVTTGGSVDFGAGSISFVAGDRVVNNGTTWDKWDMTDAVASVNGQTGVVVVTKSDVGLSNVDNTSDATKNAASVILTNKTIDGSNNTISNVNISSGTTGTLPLNRGGTGQTTKAPAFDALSPMSAIGDMIYGGASGTGTRLAKGSDGDILTLASGLPTWAPAAAGSSFRISTHLATGSRVTGTAPTALGEYRSYLRNASSVTTFTETNGAPTAAPSTANGVRIYSGNAHAAADTNGEPTRYEIFIGANKSFQMEWYKSAARTGYLDATPKFQSTSNEGLGYLVAYDSTTGIVILTGYRWGAPNGHFSGVDDLMTNITDAYFDIIVQNI